MTKALIPADQVRFFSGSSKAALAENIAHELGVPLDEAHITRFSNYNLYIQLGETVRYRRVYIVQSLLTTCQRAPDGIVHDARYCAQRRFRKTI